MPYKDPEKAKEHQRLYKERNRTLLRDKNRKYRAENKERINKRQCEIRNNPEYKEQQSAYYQNNKDKIKEYKKKYRQERKDILSQKNKKYYVENKDRIIARDKKYYQENKDTVKSRVKKWRDSNKDKMREYSRNRMNILENRISKKIRGRIQKAIKQQYGDKAHMSVELLGCSVDECRKWLESKFLPGMTWDNHGRGECKWQIDHIMPCTLFDLTKPEEQLKCFHYTNLQPLWQHDNLSKQDKIEVLTSEGVFLV